MHNFRRILITTIPTLALAAWGSLFVATSGDARHQAGVSRVPVLAELFTSEGCSSCPSADDLLRRLIAEQPIDGVEVIALSEHVDYWNRLGWRDPFSSPRFSERQNEYASALGASQIYTPQLVIDGRVAVVGSDVAAVRRSLAEAARDRHATLAVSAIVPATQSSRRSATVRASVTGLSGVARTGTIRVLVAIVEDALVTEVVRGENARRRLRHDAVVRVLDSMGAVGDDAHAGEFTKDIGIDPNWSAGNLRVVVFLQDDRTRRVVGAASAKIG